MLAAVRSAAVLGVDAFDVTVEVDCTRGLPQWSIVGMPASSVKESRERVAAALLLAFGIVAPESVKDAVFLGELGLDGSVRPVRGVLSVARRLKCNGGQ